MRWLILIMMSVLLGACAGSIGPQTNPIGSPLPRDPTATDRVDPTTTAAATTASPPIEPTGAPTSGPGFRADLPDLGAAPELNNEVWLNTDRPLRIADLRGKVVLIDMWTFG
jgi:hypothetical protein